jgi:hypothetical protein
LFWFNETPTPRGVDSCQESGTLLCVEKSRERSLARRIVRATAKNMKPFGYTLTKPTFICNAYPQLVAFFHFHKYSFAPRFRVHFGIRVLNSDFRALHLNGPSSDEGTGYGEDDQSVSTCAQKMTELVINEGLSWVESWLLPEKLISGSGSPLSEEARASLRSAIEKGPDPKRVALSYKLLGIKKRAD